MAIFTLTPANDQFTGNQSENNTFVFAPSTLQPTDTITGGATGSFLDTLLITDGGTVSADQFSGVSGIEELRLASGNAVTLTNGLVAGAAGGFFSVFGGSGTETVDGSSLNGGTRIIFFAGSDTDAFTGGTADDSFVFDTARLSAADVISGGGGVDTLLITGAGGVAGSAFAQVSSIEALSLSNAGNTVTLTNSLLASSDVGFFSVFDGTGNDIVDASGTTNGAPIIFFSAGGNDIFLGNTGNNSFVFAAADLNAADIVQASGGIDTLVLSSGGALDGTAFNNVSGIESLLLSNGGNALTLTNGFISGSGVGFFQVFDGTGNDIVDARGVTNATPIVFYSAGGNDTLVGGNGQDSFVFASADLTSADVVQGGGGFDTIFLSSPGGVTATSFTNVAGFETLAMATGGSTITLTNGLVGTSTLGFFQVAALGGNNIVDGSSLTNGMTIVFYAGPGSDTFVGGAQNDTFVFDANELTAADTVIGGGGSDILLLNAPGTLNAADVAGVSGIETVWQQAGGTFNFINGLSSSGSIRALGSAAADNFDGNAVTAYGITFQANGGADRLIGGAGADRFEVPDSAFTQIDGNGGIDRIVLSAASQSFDLTANVAKISDVEVIDLTSAAGATLTLAGADIPQVNASGHFLYVLGDFADQVRAGDGYSLVSATHTNATVAPGVTFVDYLHTNGSHLYIADTIGDVAIGSIGNNPPVVLLDGPPAGSNDGSNHSASYVTGNAAGVAISDTDAIVDDPDTTDNVVVSSQIAQLVAHLNSAPSGSLEYLTLTTFGHDIIASRGMSLTGDHSSTLQINGTTEDSVYQALLREIRYVNTDTSGALNTSNRTVSVAVQDGLGLSSSSRTATISLANGNHAPSSAGNTTTTAEDATYTFKLTDFPFADADAGDSLQAVRIDQLPAASLGVLRLNGVAVTAGTLVPASEIGAGHLTFVPTVNANGTGAFTYSVEDQSGMFAASPATMSLTLTAVNDAPVANPNTVTTNEDTAIIINVLGNDTDIDGTVVAVSQVNGTAITVGQTVAVNGGTVTLNADETLTFTPTANTNGDTTFTYRAIDNSGALSAGTTVTVHVTAVNDAPVVDLNGAAAGIDRTDIPAYISGATAINVAQAVATVSDVEGAISRITLTLTADSGTIDTGAEGLSLPPGAAAFLNSIGFTVTGENTGTIEIVSNTAGGISPSVFEGILHTVLYHDTDTSFDFNPQDRTITVTATDGGGTVSAPAHVHVDLAANVIDADGAGERDAFVGANLADTIQGNTGDDTLEGKGGDDTLYGGTTSGDSGTDTAVFTGTQDQYTITRVDATTYTVADAITGRDGTDTLHGIEVLHFASGDDVILNAPIRVFDSEGHLLASYDAAHLADAVAFANGHANATGADLIEVDTGAYTASNMTISEAVTIRAVGGVATINTAGNGFAITESAVHAAGATVRLEGLSIVGNGTAPDTVGVSFNGAYEGNTAGTIELIATSASGFGQDGVAIIGGGSALTVTIDGDNPTTTGTTETATFTGSGYQASSGGTGDILFFGFTGAAALSNIAVTGTTGIGVGAADHGIQFAGYDPADASIDHGIGNVSLSNVTVSGTYEKTLVFVQGYDDLSGLHFTGTQIGSASGTQTTWTGLYVTGGPTGPSFIPDAAPPSTLTLTGVTYAGGTFGTSPGFSQFGGRPAVIVGTPTADVITGTAGSEVFFGTTGDDTITSGGGNDLIIYNVGDGHDTVTDSAGTDTLALANLNASLLPSATSAAFTVTAAGGDLIVNTDAGGTAEVDATGIDALQIQFGNGGDTATLSGNLSGAGIATALGGIAVVGGSGADTLDASGLTSTNAIATGPGGLGGGSDTFKAADVLANDNVDGGLGTDTADYSAATAAVTIDLTAGTSINTVGGHDTITSFENAIGGAGNDSITGTSVANNLSGGAGNDTLTGGLGDDTLTGGTDSGTVAAHDVAVFSGDLADYTFDFTTVPGSVLVHNISTGETDTVSGVEELQFAGGHSVLLVNAAGSSLAAIQQGVDATGAGDIVYVGTGIYQEQVQIDGHGHDGLQVIAVPGATATVQATSTLISTGASPSNGRDIDGLITVSGANDVTLRGLHVDGASQGGHVVGASNPTFVGIAYLNSDGGVIDGVTVTGIREPDSGFGNQRGLAIYVSNANPSPSLPLTPSATEAANLNAITIENSTVSDFQKGAIVVTNADVTIHDNTVTGAGLTGLTAQNGIQVSGSTGTIDGNTVTGIGYSVPANAYSYAILTFNNRDLVIDGNHITGTGIADGSAGVAAIDSVGAVVTNNDLHQVVDAIDVYYTDSAFFGPDPLVPSTGGFDYSSNAVDANVPFALYFDPNPASTDVFDVTGTGRGDEIHGGAAADILRGGAGDDLLEGRGGADTLIGGVGNDIYLAQAIDTVTEGNGAGSGIDEVRTTDNYTLSANVENLTLIDTSVSNIQTFDTMALGPITNGENGSAPADTQGTNGAGWTVNGPNAPRDQAVIDLGGGNHGFRMSSDPSVPDFAGPYSPQLSAAASETATGAQYHSQSISFDFQAVSATPDGSRLEVDFGTAAGTDRNNFMVIESSPLTGGLRIAVNEPKLNGDFTTNDFTAFTGNVTLATGVDPTVSHHIDLRLTYNDGPDNDVIQVYLDGRYIGTTTTFENFHDAAGGTHDTNAAANLTDRVFFRPTAGGAPNDGPGLQNQGFVFDNVATSVYNNTSGTGNDLANVITGNSGDNNLEGLDGNDTLNGNAGIDTAVYRDAAADYDITATTNGHGLVTGFSQVQEHGGAAHNDGADTLNSVERLTFQNGTPGNTADDVTLDVTQMVQLFDGADHLVGTFAHIQDAINAGSAGYTVRLAAGTYNEAVDLNKDISILGANSGIAGTAVRGAESVLLGGVTINADGATIDGVELHGSFSPGGTPAPVALYVLADGFTIGNSLLQGGGGDFGILTAGGLTGLSITGNHFAGYDVATYISGNTAGTITGNLFDSTNGNAVNTESQTAVITNNIINQTIGGEIQVLSADQTVDASAFVHDNTYTGTHEHPVQIYPNYTGGAAVSTGTELGDSFNGDLVAGPGPFTFHGLGGNDHAYGSALNDSFFGDGGDDILEGKGGDDTFHGAAGNDALYGGTSDAPPVDAGTDTATYDETRSNYTIAMHTNGDGFVDSFSDVTETTIVGTNEGHDTLSGIEVLEFSDQTLDLTDPVQLFHAGALAGTFSTIQDAADAAVAGDTVLINGNIQPVFNENVTLSAGITLRGIGAVTIDGGTGGPAVTVTGGAGGALTIDNVDLTGTATYVMLVDTGASYSAITFENGDVTGGAYAGFFLNHATGVTGVTVANANFSGAAPTDSLSAGESEIYFYQYNGDVALTNVTVTGPNAATGLEYGIQMVGASPSAALGDVSFENVIVGGTFVKAGVAVDTFANVDGLTFFDPAGAPSGLTVNVSAGFAGINFDNIGGTLDLAGEAVSASNTASAIAFDIDLQGTAGNEILIGNNNDNFFNGKGGDDTETGGSGNDVFLHVAGDGHDIISGGTQPGGGADVLLVAGQSGFAAATMSVDETINIHLDNTGHIDQIDGGGSIAGIEIAALDMDGGVDTLDYTGTSIAVSVDLGAGTATGFSAIPALFPAVQSVENVTGGSAGDTLTGSTVANVLMGGDGDDTFTGGAGNDTLYGGTTTADASPADTANFSGNSTDYQITFAPFQAGDADGIDATVVGADGTDTLHGIEFLHFAGNNATIDLTERVFLTDSAGTLIGTFHNIQDAVDASNGSGEHILVRNGTYTEQVTIGTGHDGLQIIGQSEDGVIIQSPSGALAVTGQAEHFNSAVRANITVDSSTGVSISNLTVDGDFAGDRTPGSNGDEISGIAFLHAGGTIDHVTVENTSNSTTQGLFGLQHGSGILIDNGTGMQQALAINDADVHDFQKTGILIWNANVTITGSDVEGIGATNLTGQNALQIGGSQGIIGGATAADANTFGGVGYTIPGTTSADLIIYEPSGALTVTGNIINGTGTPGAQTEGIDLSDVAAGRVVTISNNVIGTAGHGLDYGIVAYTFDPAKGLASDPVISGNTFANIGIEGIYLDPEFVPFGGTFATNTAFTETGTQIADELHGSNGADTFSGGAGNDTLQGRHGADTIHGDGGDDIIIWNAGAIGDGNDAIDGGADHDELDVATNGHSITLTAAGDHFTISQDDSQAANTATVTAVEDVDITLSGGETVTITGDFSGTGIAQHTITIDGHNGTIAETVDASGISTAYPVDVVFTGGTGNDTFKSGAGNDTFHGGAGNDTAVFHGNAADATIAWNGTTATVTTAADGTDKVDSVGRLTFADGHSVWLVDDATGSEYTTLAQLFDNDTANGEAAAGDIIILADGTYVGDVTIDEAVTIRGANAGTLGTASRAPEAIIQGQLLVTAGATIDGVEILNTSNNATQFIGVRIQNTSADVTIRDSVFYSTGPNGNAEDRGVNMDTTVHGHVTIAGNLFTGAQQGAGDEFSTANWQRGVWSDGGESQLDITGNRFDHIRSGINLDGLNNATTNVSGNDFKFDGTGVAVGGNYVGSPAPLNLTAIHDNTFNNTAEDISVQNLTSPVTFDATATHNTATETGTPVFLVDGGQSTDTLVGTAGGDILIAHATNSLAGNDSNTLTGKGGADFLVGAVGAGIDTAAYAGTIIAANIAVTGLTVDANPLVGGVQAGWTVNGGSEGTDTLFDIEIVQGADPAGPASGRFLLVGNGGFATIQDALNASADGDTIMLAPGEYTLTSALNIDHSVTILGANYGKPADGSRGAESIIDGTGLARIVDLGDHAITVTIDGVSIAGDHVFDEGTPGQTLTITDSVFNLTTNAANSFYFGYGGGYDFTFSNNAVTATGYNEIFDLFEGGHVHLTDNHITGVDGAYTAPDDNNIPLAFNISGTDGEVQGNTFTHVDIGVLVANAAGPLDISGNTFTDLHRDGPASGNGRAAGVVFFQPDFAGAVNIHDNTFSNADAGIRTSAVPGTTVDGSPIVIDHNTFSTVTDVGFQPVGGVLHFTDSTVDGVTVPSEFFGGTSDDTIAQTAAVNDIIHGNAGLDSVTGYAAGATIAIENGHWVVHEGASVDTLDGVESVVIGGTTYLLVDQLGTNGGFHSVQAAINAAPVTGGATILIAPGTYSESAVPTEASASAGGLYIDRPNLTLQGVDGNGAAITTAAGAQSTGATIISGQETDFGSNHFVGVAGTGTVIQGLHLQAGPETSNKLLEIWANNVTVENDFLDVYAGGTTYTFAAAIYFNDNGNAATDNITAYTVDGNILNEGIIVANGVGTPGTIGANQLITDNRFEGTFVLGSGEGRYDTVAINGQVAGVAYLAESTQTPTMTGNTFGDNSTPFLLRGSDNDPSHLPNAAQVADFLANNGGGNTTYAHALAPGGALDTATRDNGGGPYHSFAVTNTIDTLNLALDVSPDNVFGDQRDYIHAGDTLVVQSGNTGTVNSQIMVEGLNVQATSHSTDLNLTLATQFSDGSAIANGGVHNVTLLDYAAGQGANVDVTGNALDNVITGNAGNNALLGDAGNDILVGGAGNDVLNGGANTIVDAVAGTGGDTADFSPSAAGLTITLSAGGATNVADGLGGHDTLINIENLTGGSGNDVLTGDSANNILIGNDGADSLFGDVGNDRLVGGRGADNLNGGTGADTFAYLTHTDGATTATPGGQDFISAFSTTEGDRFIFDDAAFTGVTADGNHVSGANFLSTNVVGTHYDGSNGSARFVFDNVAPGFAGTLWFDQNGNGELSDAVDVRIADFSADSDMSGFNQTHLLLL